MQFVVVVELLRLIFMQCTVTGVQFSHGFYPSGYQTQQVANRRQGDIHMKQFKPSLLTLALATTGLVSGYSYAEEAEASAEGEDIEVISVSGVRSSVLKALDTKRSSDVVGDFVGGGDLGVLPDPSIADALGRVPGVTTVRENGQSSQLNIRGMNGDFIQTTLNGREQASTAGYTESTRWMSFDQYPAELITEAAVFKSPKASHIEGGVAGLVELKTVNPLNAKDDHNVRGSARVSYNDAAGDVGADETGHRLSISYTGKFFDEKLGVGLGVSYLNQPNSFVKARAGADDADHVGYDASADYNGDGSNDARARAFQWQAGVGEDERTGILGTVVFKPNDSFKAQLDYFRSEFDRKDLRHGITASGMKHDNADNLTVTNANVVNGLVKGATIGVVNPKTTGKTSPWFEARTEDQTTVADSESVGLNLEWNITDEQTLTFDYAKSEGTKTRKDRIVSMHGYDLTTDADGKLTAWEETANQSMTYVDNGDAFPTATFNNVDFTDLDTMRMSNYEEFPHLYTDDVESVKLDYKILVDLGFVKSFETGFRISERTFDSDRGIFKYGSRDGQFGSTSEADNCERNMLTPDSQGNKPLCMPHSLDGFVTVDSVTGAPDHLVITDFDGLATRIFGAGNYDGKKVFSDDWTFVESGSVTEKTDAIYFVANFEGELGGIYVTGNAGVRYVETDIKASGLQNVGSGKGIEITDGVGVKSSNFDYVTYGPTFSDTLPSINLNFEITDDDIIRFAAAKVLGRPPVGQLKGGAGSWNSGENNSVYNVWTKGSPYLDPFRANQIDISYEHYFEGEGAFTAAVFWKDIESLVEKQFFSEADTGQEFFDNLGIEIPAGQTPGAFETYVNNDKGGYIRGLELAVTNTFSDLPGVLSGLGLTASYSYTESETEVAGGNFYGENLPLPGLSENVWSTTLFWDIGNFASHINVRYRDEFIVNMSIPGGSTPVFSQEYTTVDAQMSYDFDNGLDVVFSVSNLTDEPNIVQYGQAGLLGEYTEFGRQYYLGVNFSY